MSKSNLYAAHGQWATRPADERFWTLADARAACKGYADTAAERAVDFGAEAVLHDGDDLVLTLDGGKGRETARMTNWGFGQLARLAAAPAEYLRKLPPHLAAQCLEAGLDRYVQAGGNTDLRALVHANGTTVLRSLTSDRYSRFWNWEVFDRLLNLEADGWRVPPGRPTKADDPAARPATEADCLRVRMAGLGINPGDPVAPAGIYASDHDLFAFLVNEDYRVDDGSDGGLSRGFFVQNSEVGASALKVTFFHYRHVCGNHICWGVENVVELAVRHVGAVRDRFEVELAGAVGSYLTRSAADETARVRRAKTTVLGATKDDVLDVVFKAISGKRRNGLPSGVSVKTLTQAYDTDAQ